MFGFMLELLLSKEKLFTRTEDKVLVATDALQRPVGEFHCWGLLSVLLDPLDLSNSRGMGRPDYLSESSHFDTSFDVIFVTSSRDLAFQRPIRSL